MIKNSDLLGFEDGKIITQCLFGELIQKLDQNNNVTNYNWNSFGHLTGVTTGSLTINYRVDGIGRRVNKSIGSQSVRTWFYRNEIQIASELDENNNARAYFVYGSLPHVPDFMVMVGSNETYRFIHDQLGSIRMVVNASTGQIAQEIEYDEFGVVLRDTNPGFQPFGFAGGHYDHDTGLVHFGARSYDPLVGRWVSKDPIGFQGDDINLYSYCGQDPVNCIDTNGLFGFQVGTSGSFFGSTLGGAYESGVAVTYSGQFGLQVGGYQSAQVRAGVGIQAGVGLNFTVTPAARQLSDLGGLSPGVGFEGPFRFGSGGGGIGDINGRVAPSYSIGIGPSFGAALYGSAVYTTTSDPLKLGGSCK